MDFLPWKTFHRIVDRRDGDRYMKSLISPRKNSKEQREYDKHLYRQRHLAGSAFLLLKQWRGIAVR